MVVFDPYLVVGGCVGSAGAGVLQGWVGEGWSGAQVGEFG